jgi:hypothetical protein
MANTPTPGTHRPPAPPPRSLAKTAHELQVTSQEIQAETGHVPSEAEVVSRTALKRAGRLLDEVRKSKRWAQFLGLGGLTLYFAGDDLRVWCRAHAESAYGLVGVAGILLGGYLVAVRVMARVSQSPDEGGGPTPPGEGGPPPSPS